VYGRRPVLLAGIVGTLVSILLFGFRLVADLAHLRRSLL
jgi:hypothetical protein